MSISLRRMTGFASVLVLASCASAPDAVTDLDASLSPLRAWFAEHAGRPRALMLLSPL